jgi:hypothetical protein
MVLVVILLEVIVAEWVNQGLVVLENFMEVDSRELVQFAS